MRRRYTIIALLAATTAAHADTKAPTSPTKAIAAELNDELNLGDRHSSAVFAFNVDAVSPLGASDPASTGNYNAIIKNPVVGLTAKDAEAFVAADIEEVGDCGGPGCGRHLAWAHGVFLYENTKDGWTPRVWHFAETVDAKEQTKRFDAGVMPKALDRKIDGADDVAKLFESTIGDPKAFAKTVSDRKEVVLYGSADGERVVGGAKVRAKLTAWNLALKVRDGVQAGASASKTLAWVAANVDAGSAKKPKAKAMPYRMLAIYEKTGDAWKLVSVSFSTQRYQ